MEAELEVDGGSSSISLVEVTEIVKHLRNEKSPGIGVIQTEILKALAVEGLSWLTHLFNIEWESGTVPKEWQTGVVVPLFKMGDQRVCAPITGVSHFSASLVKSTLSCWKGGFS